FILTCICRSATYRVSLAHEGSLLERRTGKAEQGVASPERFATAPGRTTLSTPGGTTPRAAIAAWSREERKQNAGPGPKNVTVERREARRRVAPAPGSRLESESPRAVMHAHRMQTQHPGAYRRSARPSSGRGMEKQTASNEEQEERSGQWNAGKKQKGQARTPSGKPMEASTNTF